MSFTNTAVDKYIDYTQYPYKDGQQYQAIAENGEAMMFYDRLLIPRTASEYKWAIENDYVIKAFRSSKTPTVKRLLKYVDLKLDAYIPSTNALEFSNFIRFALGKEPENLNSKAQFFFIDCLFGSPEVEPYFTVRNIAYADLIDTVLILSSREFAKALQCETLIATPSGPVEIQDIEDGDMVISRTGKPTRVIKKSEMMFDNTFEMKMEDGRSFKSSNDHKHILWKRKSKYVGYFKDGVRCSKADGGKAWSISGMEEVEMTSQELFEAGATRKRAISPSHKRGYENIYSIPRMNAGIQYDPVHSPIDPYTVGVILGDGSVALGHKLNQGDFAKKRRKTLSDRSDNYGKNYKYDENQEWSNGRGATRITVHKDDLESLLSNLPYDCKVLPHTNKAGTTHTVMLPPELNQTIVDFIGVERSYTKRVPKVLLTGSVSQRLAVLQGLMDTDGTIVKKGSTSFTSVSKGLAEDVVNLVQTLGGSATITKVETNSDFGVAYHVNIRINTYSMFRLQRKKDREIYAPARDYFPIKSFELVHSEPAYCLTVECPTQSFVMANGLLTHNSVLIIFYILYLAYYGEKPGFGKVKMGIYVSDKMEGNVQLTMRTIKNIIKKSEFLMERFEYTKFTDSKVILVRKPTTKREIKAYEKGMKAGLNPDEIKYRDERTFTLIGLGSSGGRGPLALDEIMYTDNGTVTMKDVKVGDYVATPTGGFSRVKKKSEVFNNDMYELKYDDGRTLKVNETHVNPVWSREDRFGTWQKDNMVTTELFEKFTNRKTGKYGKEQFATMITKPVEYSEKKFTIDPYLLGVAMGDGHLEYGKGLRIKGIDFHAEHYYEKLKNKYDITKAVSFEDSGTRMIKLSVHGINKELKQLGIAGVVGEDKFIPREYFSGSIEQRRELLAGLLDTDGSCAVDARSKASATTFTNISKHLADGVVELARGLGYRASISHKDRGGNRKRLYTVTISGVVNPFTLKYKADSFIPLKRNIGVVKLVSIKRISDEPSQCITLDDENHEFLTTGYLTTHNSRDEELGRPDFACFDDMVANELDAYSEAKLKAIESTINSDVGKSLSGNGHFKVFIGTAYHEGDPIYGRVEKGITCPVVFPKAERVPYHDVPADEFISVWADRHTYENQRKQVRDAEIAYENGNPEDMRSILQEYYIQVTSSKDRLIPESCIKFASPNTIGKASEYLWRITTDFTTTSGIDSDDSAASLWAIDYTGALFLYDMSAEQLDIEEQYDVVIDMAFDAIRRGARIVEIGIEIDATQGVHLYAFRKRAEEKGLRKYMFAKQVQVQEHVKTSKEGIRSKDFGNKLERMKLIAPSFHKGRVMFNSLLQGEPVMDKFLDQLDSVTHMSIKSKHDDILDTVSQNACISDINLPREPRRMEEKTKYNDVNPMDILHNHQYDLIEARRSSGSGEYDIDY